ncbi:unnamed protein product [Cylindrotheca closterium]|uniref:Uncharacterized protein n=1 Tax=Cylindrotheca closterium TaxID=2856 RepID=A0AAD2G0V9_9STRA|nr:unnamed protein product [Cylindrotheca closterium]
MKNTPQIVITILCFITVVFIPLIVLITWPKDSSGGWQVGQTGDDEWQVEHVGGMGFDKMNSNVYLTSSATSGGNATTARCLIRMLSFSAETGFASVNHRVFPRSSTWPDDYTCPGDPRCILRRHLQEDFQQVDETSYPYTCSNIYIENDKAVILGRLSHESAESTPHGGLVMVMKLDSNKIGGTETQEFRLREEPLVAALDGEDILYLTSHSHSTPRSINLFRYFHSEGTWKFDWRTNHVVSGHGEGTYIASLNVILGGQYLILSGSNAQDHDHSSGHFGVYDARDGSIVEDVHGSSSVLQEPNAQKHDIECVCVDEQQSDESVAILYRASTVSLNGKTFSIVNKLRLEKDIESQQLRQSHIWTEEIMHASMEKCQVANEALILAGYAHSHSTGAALTISKHSTLNGGILWTTKQSTDVRLALADIVMDNQNNVLVYGQVSKDDDRSDNVVLQALDGSTGKVLAQSNSPPMVATQRGSASSPRGRSWDIVSREELISNYQFPMTILIVGLIVSILLVLCMAASYRESAKEQERKTFQKRIMNVFSYLKPFEATEVDLQQSPTGGFNGTYTDELVNKESETEKVSVLQDSASKPLSARL